MAHKDQLSVSYGKPEEELIRNELAKLLSSASFIRAKRQRAFLSYVVNMTLEGRQNEISEYSIAARIYERPDSFDPSSDPTVRVEVRRLRARLESYYAAEGQGAPVIFRIPAGTYMAEVQFAAPEPAALSAPEPAAPAAVVETPAPARGNRLVRFAAALVAVVLSVSGMALWGLRLGSPRQTGFWETVPLTSYPGRQLQPALSPDRQRMAFSWNGDDGANFDIYVKSVWGRDIARLTKDPAREQSPAWSPDGRSIAFLRQLPDMRQAVLVMAAEGGGERQVTTISTNVAGIAWSSDSRWLFVPDSGPNIPLGLFRVSVLTGERRQITDFKGDFQPTLSPDGRTLAFVCGQRLPVSSLCLQRLTAEFLADGAPEPLDLKAAEPSAEYGTVLKTPENVGWPSWSRDGSSILFTRYTSAGTVPARLNLAARRVETIAGLGADTYNVLEYSAQRYIFNRRRYHRFLAWAHPDGTARTLEFAVSQDDADPDLSPDGSRLAFVSGRKGVPGLYVAQSDGREPRRIDLPGVTPASPRWSPDSAAIVFTGWRDSFAGIYVTGPTGPAHMIATGAEAHNPVFSRNGKWIYYSSYQGGLSRIWRIALSGGTPELITQDPGSYAEESADGTKLYFGWRSSIRQLDLKSRRSEPLFEGVFDLGFRSTSRGIYAVESGSNGIAWQIRFHPFAGAPSAPLAAGDIAAFCLKPGGGELLIAFDPEMADIEAASFR